MPLSENIDLFKVRFKSRFTVSFVLRVTFQPLDADRLLFGIDSRTRSTGVW